MGQRPPTLVYTQIHADINIQQGRITPYVQELGEKSSFSYPLLPWHLDDKKIHLIVNEWQW